MRKNIFLKESEGFNAYTVAIKAEERRAYIPISEFKSVSECSLVRFYVSLKSKAMM